MVRPNTEIDLLNENGKIISGGKASFLYPRFFNEYNNCLDLKVLYIGQAYGEDLGDGALLSQQ
jgi:hypothetical protein